MQRINVLQVLGSLNRGGAESRLMDVYRKVDRNKVRFDFLIFQDGEQYFEKEVNLLGGSVIRAEMPSRRHIFKHIKELRRVIREGQYNAVHSNTSFHSGLVMYAAWIEHIPVRITHSRTTGTLRKKKGIIERIGKILIRLFATVRLSISNDAGVYLFENCSYEVLPNAIDIVKYQTVNHEKNSSLREQYLVPDNAFVIGQIGRFDPMKNHQFTIEWFSQYSASHEDAILILVGEGQLKNYIERTVREKGLSDKVRFTGAVDNVNELLHIIHVMIFPSFFEGLGGVVLEAEAAGVPTVMTDTLPKETDLGLNMITRCDLHSSLDSWTQAVDKYRGFQAPDNEAIKEGFEKKGYSLSVEIERLMEIYVS